MPHVISIQVGSAQAYPPDRFISRPLRSGIIKHPVHAPVWVAKDRLIGDNDHDDPDRAVLGYAADHYADWRQTFPEFDFPIGAFGENLTMAGLTEDGVCLGDIHGIGDVVLQVTQPRYPCPQLARRCGIDDLHTVAAKTNRYGWLYKVLQEGYVEAGLSIELLDRPQPQWSVSRAFSVLRAIVQREPFPEDLAQELAACPELASFWREKIHQALETASG